ncbi:MAG: VTT domain-containing protein [Acidobacteria bacterium]|jgi:membrane protein DedA with SNARE-associated domain|nr:VTT domain-containing protein [Acidobacteriota bacterium]
MERLVSWVQGFALALGGPGLFLIAVLDSSFLSFPEVVDLLIVVYVTHHKERMVYYATLATLGSIAGCFLLYWVGRRGGERFLRKKLHEQHVDRALAMFQKHGLLAVIIPSLLPPPVPFKPFVLIAGIAGVRTLDFLLAVALGRGVRYFGEGLLAVWYGERAADFIRHNASTVSLVLAIAALVFGAGWMWYKSRRARLS